MGKSFKIGQLTMEDLLATEKLEQETAQAEAGTPQAFAQFVQSSEREAIEEKKEPEDEFASDDDLGGEENPDGEDLSLDEVPSTDGDTPYDANAESPTEGLEEDAELTDTVEEDQEETKATQEALDDWIRSKTQDSNSRVVRNVGELAAGLAHLGIKYGPVFLQAMLTGTLWTFSRLGTMLFQGSEGIGTYIERSRNSLDKLDRRLENAQRVIADQLNDGRSMPSFVYRNGKVISYLKVGRNLDFAGNLRMFSTALVQSNNSVAHEFEAGCAAVERLAQSASRGNVKDFAAFMKVEPPRRGFNAGAPDGYKVDSEFVDMFHTEPMWPGDACLVYAKPKTYKDMGDISEAYKAADMFIATGGVSVKAVQEMKALTSTDLLLIAKSAKILISACKEVSKTHEKLKKYDESMMNAAKRLFYTLADEKAAIDDRDTIVDMVYLRAMLATKVYSRGATSCLTHASRVLSAAVQLLEDHAKKLATTAR